MIARVLIIRFVNSYSPKAEFLPTCRQALSIQKIRYPYLFVNSYKFVFRCYVTPELKSEATSEIITAANSAHENAAAADYCP